MPTAETRRTLCYRMSAHPLRCWNIPYHRALNITRQKQKKGSLPRQAHHSRPIVHLVRGASFPAVYVRARVRRSKPRTVRELTHGDRRRPNAQHFGCHARDVLIDDHRTRENLGWASKPGVFYYCTCCEGRWLLVYSRARMYGPREKKLTMVGAEFRKDRSTPALFHYWDARSTVDDDGICVTLSGPSARWTIKAGAENVACSTSALSSDRCQLPPICLCGVQYSALPCGLIAVPTVRGTGSFSHRAFSPGARRKVNPSNYGLKAHYETPP